MYHTRWAKVHTVALCRWGGPEVELGSGGPVVWNVTLVGPEDRCQAGPCLLPDVRAGCTVCQTVY